MNEKLNYTFQEAAEAMQVSFPTLRKFTRTPGFPLIRAGRKILIPIEPLKHWLEAEAARDNHS